MTIAKQLGITKFPFVIKNDAGNVIYREESSGRWVKREYGSSGFVIYSERSDGSWSKREWDGNGNRIYFENRDGYWEKREFNDNGNQIYFEDNTGRIVDSRLKPWRHDLITQIEEMVSRLEEDGLYALQGIKDAIAELKK